MAKDPFTKTAKGRRAKALHDRKYGKKSIAKKVKKAGGLGARRRRERQLMREMK